MEAVFSRGTGMLGKEGRGYSVFKRWQFSVQFVQNWFRIMNFVEIYSNLCL